MSHGLDTVARVVAVSASALVLSACASTSTFYPTWQNPDAKPVAFSGRTVLAVVQVGDTALRRRSEDALVATIASLGAKGVASYTVLDPGVRRRDDAAVRADARHVGASEVIIMQLPGEDVTVSQSANVPFTEINGAVISAAGYGRPRLSDREPNRREQNAVVETRVYSLDQEKMVWAGTSKSQNRATETAVIREAAALVVQEMKRVGILAQP